MSMWKSLHRLLRRSPGHANASRSGSGRRQRLVVESLEDRLCLSDFTVVANGLQNPRGLTFGPDGQLYVAEGGPSTNALPPIAGAPQVPAAGPYTGGYNGRISKINVQTGARTTVVSGLPSSQTNPALGSQVAGVSAVQFIGDTLYGMEAGGGRSHAVPDNGNPVYSDNTIFRVHRDGSVSLVADLSTFIQSHSVANPDLADFEPDGTWYSMVAVHGALYFTEPNHQEVDRITPDGQISRVIDMSVEFPGNTAWVGPTGLTYHGNFYLGTLGTFPVTPGTQSLYKLTPSGQLHVAASGLTAVLSVAFDHEGRLYALETDTVVGFPGPAAAGSGKVVRVNRDGTLTTIASGLTFPTAMTFGPDGDLYVSNVGFGVPDNPPSMPDPGQVVRIELPRRDRDDFGGGDEAAAATWDSKPVVQSGLEGASTLAGGLRLVESHPVQLTPLWETGFGQVPSTALPSQGMMPLPSSAEGLVHAIALVAGAREKVAAGFWNHAAVQHWVPDDLDWQ